MEDSRCSFGQGSLFERENVEKIARRITNQLERSSSTLQSDVANSDNSRSRTSQCETHEVREEENKKRKGQSQSRSSRSSSNQRNVDYSNNTFSKGNGSTFGIQEEYSNVDSSSSNEPQQIIGRQELELFAQYAQIFWTVESSVGRVVNGLPNRLHRLRQLGNSVVPQIPEFLGHCILNWQEAINEANRR
jgi:hypothetical protein